jgi:hypothetical protein
MAGMQHFTLSSGWIMAQSTVVASPADYGGAIGAERQNQ